MKPKIPSVTSTVQDSMIGLSEQIGMLGSLKEGNTAVEKPEDR